MLSGLDGGHAELFSLLGENGWEGSKMQLQHALSELTKRQCETLTSFKEKHRILPHPQKNALQM